MDIEYISNHIKCTKEEKILCMETVKKLLRLLDVARREGILKLEETILEKEYESPSLIQIGALLIIDGTDPEHVRNILGAYPNKFVLANAVERSGNGAVELASVVSVCDTKQEAFTRYEVLKIVGIKTFIIPTFDTEESLQIRLSGDDILIDENYGEIKFEEGEPLEEDDIIEVDIEEIIAIPKEEDISEEDPDTDSEQLNVEIE